MKLRLLVVAAVVLPALAACGRFLVVQDKFDASKKVAVVQYSINGMFLMGYAGEDAAKTSVASANYDTFLKQMGNIWQIVPMAELTANAAYTAGGSEKVDHWATAPGLRYYGPDNLFEGELTPDVAKKLCADLGVDAVITLSEQWNYTVSFFRGYSNNTYYVNAWDKDGTKIWADAALGRSTESFGVAPGGAVTSDAANWTLCNTQAFTDAVTQFRGHLGK